VRIGKGFSLKIVLLFLVVFFLNTSAYSISVSRKSTLRIPIGREGIERMRIKLDRQLAKYYRANKQITYSHETGKFTLHLFSDFDETITSTYEEHRIILPEIVAASIKSDTEKQRFIQEFANRDSFTPETVKNFYTALKGKLKEEHCRKLAESWSLNKSFEFILETIKEKLGVDSINVTVVSRGIEQSMQMFFNRPEIRNRLENMSVNVVEVVANSFVFDKEGIFTGEIKGRSVENKIDYVPNDALFLGDKGDRKLSFRYFIDVNGNSGDVDIILSQLLINTVDFHTLQKVIEKKKLIHRSL